MKTRDRRPGYDWTVVLRRQPARMVEGRPEGGYTNMFELICRDCGDHPHRDYREISPVLQRIRGPYPVAVGVARYGRHVRWHQSRQAIRQPGHSVVAVGSRLPRGVQVFRGGGPDGSAKNHASEH